MPKPTHYQFKNHTLVRTDIDMDAHRFCYGDGFFSTMGVRDGQILWQDGHAQRLTQGAFRFQLELDAQTVMQELARLAQEIKNGILKVIVLRRAQSLRGYGFFGDKGQETDVLVKAVADDVYGGTAFWYSFPVQTPGQASLIDEVLGIRPPRLAGLKLIGAAEQVFAHRQLLTHQHKNPNIKEGLVKNTNGLYISGTMSNVFYRLNAWYTPPTHHSGVDGVAKSALMHTFMISERPLCASDLPNLTGLFFSNAVRGIIPIKMLWHHDTPHCMQTGFESLTLRPASH